MTELEAARKRIAELEEELAAMARQLAALTRYVFGKRSEQTPPPSCPGQLDLALETQQESPPPAPPAKPGRPKGGSRKGRQTRAGVLPGHLPVEETILVDPRLPADPGGWREISRVSTDRLERGPRRLIILRV
ncbi:MAG: Transposase of homeodomain, partial [Verrucomicrobiales bacterium]|nr:Transposase of homeodomain [Verrucomicrobiales bacterium]